MIQFQKPEEEEERKGKRRMVQVEKNFLAPFPASTTPPLSPFLFGVLRRSHGTDLTENPSIGRECYCFTHTHTHTLTPPLERRLAL
jgi:hypothetical protein